MRQVPDRDGRKWSVELLSEGSAGQPFDEHHVPVPGVALVSVRRGAEAFLVSLASGWEHWDDSTLWRRIEESRAAEERRDGERDED